MYFHNFLKEQQTEILYNEGWQKQIKENAYGSCECA